MPNFSDSLANVVPNEFLLYTIKRFNNDRQTMHDAGKMIGDKFSLGGKVVDGKLYFVVGSGIKNWDLDAASTAQRLEESDYSCLDDVTWPTALDFLASMGDGNAFKVLESMQDSNSDPRVTVNLPTGLPVMYHIDIAKAKQIFPQLRVEVGHEHFKLNDSQGHEVTNDYNFTADEEFWVELKSSFEPGIIKSPGNKRLRMTVTIGEFISLVKERIACDSAVDLHRVKLFIAGIELYGEDLVDEIFYNKLIMVKVSEQELPCVLHKDYEEYSMPQLPLQFSRSDFAFLVSQTNIQTQHQANQTLTDSYQHLTLNF